MDPEAIAAALQVMLRKENMSMEKVRGMVYKLLSERYLYDKLQNKIIDVGSIGKNNAHHTAIVMDRWSWEEDFTECKVTIKPTNKHLSSSTVEQTHSITSLFFLNYE